MVEEIKYQSMEDKIKERLKGVCDHKAIYIVSFSNGYVEVEEIEDPSKIQKELGKGFL